MRSQDVPGSSRRHLVRLLEFSEDRLSTLGCSRVRQKGTRLSPFWSHAMENPEADNGEARPHSARYSRRQKAVWAAVAVVLVFVLSEGLLRVAGGFLPLQDKFVFLIEQMDNDWMQPGFVIDPDLFWRMRPNISVPGVDDTSIKTNFMGLRDDAQTWAPSADTRRMLCLGDSVTFGYRVEAKQTYPEVLQRMLNAKSGRVRYEVINAGMTGYSSFQGLHFLQRDGFRTKPFAVTACFGLNDSSTRYGRSDREVWLADSRTRPVRQRLRSLRLYSLIRWGVLRLYAARRRPEAGSIARVSVREFRANLQTMACLCRDRGIHFLLLPPISSCSLDDLDVVPYIEAVRGLGTSGSIPVVDLFDMTATGPEANWIYFADRAHPNPVGHRRIAERLYRALARLGILTEGN